MDYQTEKLWKQVRDLWPIVKYRPNRNTKTGESKQDQFHRSKAGIRVLSGGNQSGKTHAGLAEDLAAMFGFRPWLSPDDPDFYVRMGDGSKMPVPNKGRLACPDFPNALSNVIYPKFLSLAPAGLIQVKKNAQGYPTTWMSPWGSSIAVMSYEQEWIKYESFTGDWMHFDEPPERNIWISSLRGLIATGGPIWLTITPHSEEWMVEELYEKEDNKTVEVIRIDTEDNLIENGGTLSRDGYERFLDALTPIEKRIRIHGEGALAGGRCVPDFQTKAPWVIEPFTIPKDWLRLMVIDPHEEKPDAALWMAIDPEKWEEDNCGGAGVIYDEVMDASTQGSLNKTAATIRVRERESGGRIKRRLIDPRAAERLSRQTQRTYREELALLGVRTETAPGLRVSKGLKMVNAWFMRTGDDIPKVQVFNTCTQTIDQCKHLIFIRDRKNFTMKIRTKGPDDFVACLRYLVTWGPNVGNLGGQDFEEEVDEEENLLTELGNETTSGSWTGY